MQGETFAHAPSPERLGIPSHAIERFLNDMALRGVTMHGFLVARRGQIAAEGYWAPYTASMKHRMYSVSKSFTSLAVGLLIDRGQLRLTDRVADYFPEKLPAKPHRYLLEATVRDLLMMATPHSEQSYTVRDADWVATFFQKKPSHPAGTVFCYDTAATVVLAAIVEKLTGQKLLDVLREPVLDPIGVTKDVRCVERPEGGSWTGSGILCTLEDLARVGELCRNHGSWNGRQLISSEYIDEATAKQIDNSQDGHPGYGYQIWRIDDGFAFSGMGSQFVYCFPKAELLFACVADTQSDPAGLWSKGAQAIYESVRTQILPCLADGELPEDDAARARLCARCASLRIPPVPGEAVSPRAAEADGVWYAFDPNPMGIRRARLRFGEKPAFEYENARGLKSVSFAFGGWAEGVFPENYFRERIGVLSDIPYRCLGGAAWVERDKLRLRALIFDDFLGGLQATIAFKGNDMTLYFTKVAEWFLDDYQGFAAGSRE